MTCVSTPAGSPRRVVAAARCRRHACRCRGVLVILAGEDGSLLSPTLPLTIADDELEEALARLEGV